MRRVPIELAAVAGFANLADAARKAGRGKRTRADVAAFFAQFDARLSALGEAIRSERMPRGRLRRFLIHDPKARVIHAADFEDRVFHHALMNLAGPVLDRALTDAVYACRVGKGNHAAALRVQRGVRRFPWYVKIDIEHYFDRIDHRLLFRLLARRFKGDPFLRTLWRVIDRYAVAAGKGLPIGALTSQHFANYYLDGFDRFVQRTPGAKGYVRYMDDCIWFCPDRQTARASLAAAREVLGTERLLRVKPTAQINRSARGVTYCGFRILPGTIRLTRRKRRLYALRRAEWEGRFRAGEIDALGLQSAYASVLGITALADGAAWRRGQLRRFPPIEA